MRKIICILLISSFISVYAQTATENDCTCQTGFRFDTNTCIQGNENTACTLEYAPVCGCDGMTYSNQCFANGSGVKKITTGECSSSSSSGDLNCATDADCPLGICSSSGTFQNYSCGNGICNQIFYFANPCDFQSSSSSGSPTKLNSNFNGIWKGKILSCESGGGISPNLEDSDCIICPQIAILCAQGFTFVSQTCHKCGYCKKCTKHKKITLNLCTKNEELSGTVNIPDLIEDATIVSHSISSDSIINITVRGKNNSSQDLTLELKDKRHLSITIFGNAYKTKKIRSNRKCTFNSSSSGEIKDCTPQGSCRGENGEELSCPNGTECSGLPAYGCYPSGCPTPVCCSPDTRIRTTGVQKRIADIKKGELVLTDDGKAVRVKKVVKVKVKNHKVLKITLSDTTVLEISPGHPTADGRKLKDLKIGDILDNRMVVKTKLIPYSYSHTYDILPDSKTGHYYANGILIGSTLK